MFRMFMKTAQLGLVALFYCFGGAACAYANGDNNAPTYPVTILRAAGGAVTFQVERAVTSAEHNQGLMFRSALPPKGGMIFIYPAPAQVQFWMKNTVIPLDMIFIDAAGKIIAIHANAQPLDLTPIDSGGKIIAVLELAGGSAAQYHIQTGDRVKY